MIATDNIGDSLFNAYLQGVSHGRQAAIDHTDVASRIQNQLNSQDTSRQDDNTAFNRALQIGALQTQGVDQADRIANSRYNRDAIAKNQQAVLDENKAKLANDVYQKSLTDAWSNLDALTEDDLKNFHPLDAALLRRQMVKAQDAQSQDYSTQNRIADLLNQQGAVRRATTLAGDANAPEQDVIKALTAARVTPDFGFGWTPSTSRTGQLADFFTGGQRSLPTVFNRTAATAPLTDRATQIQNALNVLMPPKTAPANFVTQGQNGAFVPLMQPPQQVQPQRQFFAPPVAPAPVTAPVAPQAVAPQISPAQAQANYLASVSGRPNIPQSMLMPTPVIDPSLAGRRPLFPVSPVQITTKDQFDALPPGTLYVGKDGRKYRKP